jgi:hypothetical protein
MIRTALYRHFAADGALLYVGISAFPTERAHQHNCRAHWATSIARIEVDHFDTREDAIAAERLAIATERPLHNVAWNQTGQKAEVNGIVAALTADAMCEALGVGFHAIRYARNAGTFPGNWYGTLLAMCDERGIDCPLDLFTWKTAAQHSEAAA